MQRPLFEEGDRFPQEWEREERNQLINQLITEILIDKETEKRDGPLLLRRVSQPGFEPGS